MAPRRSAARALRTRRARDGTLVIQCPDELRDAFIAMAEAQGIGTDQLLQRLVEETMQRRERKRKRQCGDGGR